MALCLSEYIGKGTRKNPYRTKVPGAAIDLRPDCSKREGYALVNTDEPVKRWKLGDGFQDTFSYRIRNAIHSRMGVDISAVKRFDVLTAKLLMEPNGWNPLRPNVFEGRYEIWLGGLVWEFPLIRGGATDDFNRPNGLIGDPWTKLVGNNFNINTNRVEAVGGSTADSVWVYTNAATSADQYSELRTVSTVLGDVGPVVRGQLGTGSALCCYLIAEAIQTSAKIVAGTFTQLSVPDLTDYDTTTNPGDWVGIRAVGTTITGYRIPSAGGSSVDYIGNNNVTDTAIPGTGGAVANGLPGIFMFALSTPADEWRGANYGTISKNFPVATANDDGTGYRTNTSWASIGSGAFTAESTTNIWASKVFNGSTDYFDDNAYVRVDSSSIPDNANIVGGRIKFWCVNETDSPNNFSLVADYFDFGGEPSVAADWVREVGTSVLDPLDLGFIADGSWNVQDLINLSGINKFGYTGLRLTLDSAATTPTTDNSVEIFGFETAGGFPVFQIEVDYTIPTTNWFFKQVASNPNGGAKAFTNNVVAGNLLVVAYETDGASSAISPPTDSIGTTYAELHPQWLTPLGPQRLCLWAGIAPSSGANTVTTDNAWQFDGFIIAEFGNVLGPLTSYNVDDHDQDALTSIVNGTDVIVGQPLIPVSSDCLMLFMWGTDQGSGTPGTYTDGSNTIIAAQTDLSLSTTDRLVLGYGFVTGTPGSVNPTMSRTGGTSTHGGNIGVLISPTAAYTPAGDAGPTLIRLIGNRQTW